MAPPFLVPSALKLAENPFILAGDNAGRAVSGCHSPGSLLTHRSQGRKLRTGSSEAFADPTEPKYACSLLLFTYQQGGYTSVCPLTLKWRCRMISFRRPTQE